MTWIEIDGQRKCVELAYLTVGTAERVIAILADPGASWWLKMALVSSLGRDPFDALGDAEVLHDIMVEKMRIITEFHTVTAV